MSSIADSISSQACGFSFQQYESYFVLGKLVFMSSNTERLKVALRLQCVILNLSSSNTPAFSFSTHKTNMDDSSFIFFYLQQYMHGTQCTVVQAISPPVCIRRGIFFLCFRGTYLRTANYGTEGNLAELLFNERPVRNASDRRSMFAQHNGAVLAVEYKANDVLLRHLRKLRMKNLLRRPASNKKKRPPKSVRSSGFRWKQLGGWRTTD